MNFIEAVQAMKEGKKVMQPNTHSKLYLYDTIFHWTNLHEQMGGPHELRLEEIEATDWEIVDEDKNWNLADKKHLKENDDGYLIPEHFNPKNVKKCRDLIIKDMHKIFRSHSIICADIVRKRFGDL